ncbi:MAG: hypothetical protein WC840_03365 [Candidatus Peribacteraceae bacterium]
MAQYNHLPVFQKTYLLTVEMYGVTSRFPRAYRFTLGEKLKALLSDPSPFYFWMIRLKQYCHALLSLWLWALFRFTSALPLLR